MYDGSNSSQKKKKKKEKKMHEAYEILRYEEIINVVRL